MWSQNHPSVRFGLVVAVSLLLTILIACQSADDTPNSSPAEPTDVAVNPVQDSITDSPAEISPISPNQDAVLLCEDNGTTLWRFTAATNRWQQLSLSPPFTAGFIPQGILPLPDSNDDLLIYGYQVEADAPAQFQMYRWQEAGVQRLVDETAVYTTLPLQTFGDSLPVTSLYAVRADDPAQPYQLDLRQCAADSCAFSPVDRVPIMSPAGQSTLIWHVQEGQIALNETNLVNQAGQPILTAQPPFWLDEARIGYLRSTAAEIMDDNELMLFNLTDQTEALLLNAATAKEVLLNEGVIDQTADIRLFDAQATTADNGLIVVAAIDINKPERAYLLLANQQADSWQFIPEISDLTAVPLTLTPNGQFLISPTTDSLQLLSLETRQLHEYPNQHIADDLRGYALSADDAWLLLPDGSTSYFIALNNGQVAEINLADQYCTLGTWLHTD